MNWEKTNYKRLSYTLTDYYLFYKNNIEKDTVYDINMKTYKAIITDYLKYIRDLIMLECREFKLPCRLGTLSIIKHRPKEFSNRSLRFDWKATKETGKAVYLLNEHSNYFKYRFHWSKKYCLLTNKTRYLFVATRENKRNLAQIIFNKLKDYPEV